MIFNILKIHLSEKTFIKKKNQNKPTKMNKQKTTKQNTTSMSKSWRSSLGLERKEVTCMAQQLSKTPVASNNLEKASASYVFNL